MVGSLKFVVWKFMVGYRLQGTSCRVQVARYKDSLQTRRPILL